MQLVQRIIPESSTAKACTKCGSTTNGFPKDARQQDGLQTRCRVCVAARDRGLTLRKLGLTTAQYDAMLALQGGVCAICGLDVPGGHGAFHVDHHHGCCQGRRSCGQCIRGLLCSRCNQGLGFFGDDPEVLRSAIKYLARSDNHSSREFT